MQLNRFLLQFKRLPGEIASLGGQDDDFSGSTPAWPDASSRGPPIRAGSKVSIACSACGLVLPCSAWADLHESEVHMPELRSVAPGGKWVRMA